MRRRISAIALAGLALLLTASLANAQYPTVIGSLTSSVSATVAAPGAQTTVSCNLAGPSGAPISGQTVTFVITGNPGGASLGSGQATTNAQGVASVTLNAGSAGNVFVTCSAGGLNSTATVQIRSGEVLGIQFTPSGIQPPATGDGGVIQTSGSNYSAPAVLLALSLLSLVGARQVRNRQ